MDPFQKTKFFEIGPNGFNVPYGNYKNPTIIDENHLTNISDLIKNVKFIHCNFSDSICKAKLNDFVYMDPPYAPVGSHPETSFVGYTGDGFNIDCHNQLFFMCNDLKKNNIKFLMSNADVPLVCNNFPKILFTIESILCKRSINSKNPSAKTKEVLINWS